MSKLEFAIKRAEAATTALEDERMLALRIHESVSTPGNGAPASKSNGSATV